MVKNRIPRLNSLIREVLSEVIRKHVKNPHVTELVTVTRVDITKDLHHAKVYVSIIGSPAERETVLAGLQSAAGFIAVHASKKMVIRYFPDLTFKLDDSVDKHMRIEELLSEIRAKEASKRTEKFLEDSSAETAEEKSEETSEGSI
jgi:ribosome-binding factor A